MFPFLFEEKFVSNVRDPILVLSIPSWGDVGLLPLPLLFWIQLAAVSVSVPANDTSVTQTMD
jgi:hypothetical protein